MTIDLLDTARVHLAAASSAPADLRLLHLARARVAFDKLAADVAHLSLVLEASEADAARHELATEGT